MKDNPSLESNAEDVFAEAYTDARDLAAAETGLPPATFPASSPFSREQAVDRAWPPPRGDENP